MQHLELLHNLLTESGAIGHKKRSDSVVKAVNSLLNGGKLSLTSIGRNRQETIQTRSKIQSTNYLLANYHLYSEVAGIYSAYARSIIGARKSVDILVDWSTLVPGASHLLRASMVCRGRSMTIYDEVHPESLLGNSQVQANFLKQVKRIVGQINVTIITDAGFRTDFFEQVRSCGFDYIGRILSNMQYRYKNSEIWHRCSDTYQLATSQAQAIGAVELSKSRALSTKLYLHKKPRKAKKISKKCATKDKGYTEKAQKPWLIASLIESKKPQAIMNRYANRMKIEHEFRDTKDEHWGLGFRFSRTKDIARLRILMMLSVLAIWLLWVIGMAAEAKNFHRHFQANSIKHKRVLSLVFLAREIVKTHYLALLGTLTIPDHLEED